MQIHNTDQAEYWANTPSGTKWLTYEDHLDRLMQPVLDLALSHADVKPGMRVLDIGCGTGASSLALGHAVGPRGHVLGADISQPFLDRAGERAAAAGLEHVAFSRADAQVAEFEASDRDAIFSRFGVMFFDDTTAAFANMARALKPGGQMTFATWGDLSGNPWFRLPHIAAAERLGPPPQMDRNAPGPLALHDLERVAGMMVAAGLRDVHAEAIDIHLNPLGSLSETAEFSTRVGPAVRVMDHFEATPEDVDAIREAVASAFAPFDGEGGVKIPALINIFQARRPD